MYDDWMKSAPILISEEDIKEEKERIYRKKIDELERRIRDLENK